ncbi:MAG TPA: type II secretion system F family protein [Sedimenticola sp.]|nr:type II secretion system F family protein [Sedimenticola sp.]
MAIFKYKGIDPKGKKVQGRIVAANVADLEMRLDHMNLELITCREVSSNRSVFGGGKITRQELINFCVHMEQMTRVGVPILEALKDLRDSVDDGRFREILSALVSSIEGGKTLSQAMEEFPRVFDEVFTNLIRAGEQSGELGTVLKDLIESLKWQDELAAQTKKVLMYPAFVSLVVVGVLFFLMLYLVPQMVAFIQSMGEEIPLHTEVLIFISNIFVDYWYLILSLPLAGVILLGYLMRVMPGVRYIVDAIKLRLWVIGPILRKITLGRFANCFALLYSSGMTVLSCIKISEGITGNRVIARALGDVRQQIADGHAISESFESAGIFPPLVLRMFKVGESTGGLDEALLNISYFYNRDVRDSVDKLQAMIEPAMTVVLGLILGWVMISVLGPIYDIISRMSL